MTEQCCKWSKKYIFSIGYREDNTSDYVLKCRHCSWQKSITGAYPIAFEYDNGNGDITETISMTGGDWQPK
jgi:hypothetical protein